MKDNSDDLRRTGRGGYTRRVRAGNLERLRELWGENGGTVHQPDHRTAKKNALRGTYRWQVRRIGGTVVATDPEGEYVCEFTGGMDPYGDAVEYAAEQLRKEFADE